MNTALTLTDITKSYDQKPIVDTLSFSVPKGVITALLGPNGAGRPRP